MGIQGFALDQESMPDQKGKGAFPADTGIKTGHEYVKYLLDQSVFKVGDAKVYTSIGYQPFTSRDDITAKNIGFRFANVSRDDPGDTIFIVTENYFSSNKTRYGGGFVVIRKNGDSSFYMQMPKDPAILGKLPPREPQFLEP